MSDPNKPGDDGKPKFPRLHDSDFGIEPCGPLVPDAPVFVPAHFRHACMIPVMDGGSVVAEVWSEAEYGRLPVEARPAMIRVLPGYGYLAIRKPSGEAEIADIKRAAEEASGAMFSRAANRPGKWAGDQ